MNLELTIPDMACSACADTIAKAVVALDATAKIAADPKTKRVSIDTQSSETVVKAAIAAAGYTVA